MTPTRGSGTEQLLHWLVAVAVLSMAGTGVVMYVPDLSEAVGQRFWVRMLHLLMAVGLLVALLIFAVARRFDAGRLERQLAIWSERDVRWFLSGQRGADERFNPGQKLFASLIATALAVLFLTGVPMYWWGWFNGALVARGRDLHVLAAAGLIVLLGGHMYLGLLSPYGLLEDWARQRRAGTERATR